MGTAAKDMRAGRRLIAVGALAALTFCVWTVPVSANPYAGGGQVLVDSGFRSDANGYSFRNYGNEGNPTNLSVGSLRRLFGDAAVCVGGGTAKGGCTLTPAARTWGERMNAGMAGGHCEGFAITAAWFYSGVGQPPNPSPFGSSTVPGLVLQGNAPLQNHIATAFVLQFLDPMRTTKINQAPNVVLSALAQNLANGEPMVLGVYKRGFKGGHAITPIAIEDRGNGQAAIVVYDNNFPNTLREVNVDTNSNTWNYTATPNPSEPAGLYEGDAGSRTLEVEFASFGLGTQPCPFCKHSARQAETETDGQLIWDGNPYDGEHSNVTITDPDGNVAGCTDEDCASAIPGVEVIPPKLGGGRGNEDPDGGNGGQGDGDVGVDDDQGEPVWATSSPPVFNIPDGLRFDVEVDADGLESPANESLSLVRDGISLGVEDLRLREGDEHQMEIGPRGVEVDNDSGHDISPTLTFGDEAGGEGYEVTVETDGLGEEASLRLTAKGNQRLKLDASGEDADVKIEVERTARDGDTEEAQTRFVNLEDGTDGVLSFNDKAMRDGKLKLRR